MKKIFTSLLALGFLWINGYSQVYIDETFDSEIPSDWTTSSEDDAYPWFWDDGVGFPTVNGTGLARVDADAAGSANNLIENLDTPGFDASAGNIVIVQFETWYNDYIGLDTGYVQVWDGSVWNTVMTIGDEFGSSNNPEYVTVIITDHVNPSGDTKVRFRYDDGQTWAFYWLIDNVKISSVDCLEPINVDITPGAVAAVVSWDSGSGNSDIVYGPAGVDPDDLAGTGGTQVDDAANPYTITDLDPLTSYEVYLRDDCGVDGTSPWAGPYAYSTTVACPNPGMFWNPFSNVSSFYATFTYTQNGLGDVYMIIGPENFIPGDAGTDTLLLTGSPYLITGLEAETVYDVYLYMDCTQNPADSLGYSSNVGPSGSALTTLPACPTPTQPWPYQENVTSTSADILYTLNGPGDGYIVIGPPDFVPGDPASDTIALTGSPMTLTGLDPLGFYDYFLFMDCSADGYDYSDNSFVRSFNTLTDAAGTSCGDPFILSSGNMPYTSVEQSICGYGNNVTGSGANNCNLYSGYEEIVYVYSPETDDEILGLFGANSTTNSTIYFTITTMCPDSAGSVCVASGSWNSNSSSGTPNFLLTTEAGDLEAGETYYITVSGYTFNGCFLDLQIFIIDCTTPTNLSYVNYPDSTVITWDFVNDSTTNWQVVWGIEGFDPGSEGTTISGNYSMGQESASITITGLSDTTAYEFYVTDECGINNVSIPAGPGTFVGPPPVNDLCANATTITCGETLTGTNITANDEGNSTDICDGGWAYPENNTVWYTFEGTGDEITLSTCGTNWNADIWVYSGACGDSLECVAFATGNYYLGEYQCGPNNFVDAYVSLQSEVGVTYTVAIAAGTTWQPPVGAFYLTMECIPCSAPYELDVVTVSNEAALINWQSFNEGATYTYEYGVAPLTPGTGTSGTGTVGTDGPPVTISGLLANTDYSFYVYETCAVGETDTLFVDFTTNEFAPPANDLCDNATVLACGDTDTSSIQYATTFGNPMGGQCGVEWQLMDINTIWYQFEGTGQEMNVSTCGSNTNNGGSFYAELFVFSGSCDALECEAVSSYQSDPDCPGAPFGSTNVSFYGEVGTTYYVGLSATGTFYTNNSETIITLDCIDCSTPTNPTAIVTDVTANISWTSFNQDADYTLTYDSIGGVGATTVTGNTGTDFPVALSGLLAGTTYNVCFYEYCTSTSSNTDTICFNFTTNALPPPANDNVCNATALMANDTLATTNLYASTEPGEPVPDGGNCNDPNQELWCNNNLNFSTWYTFTPMMSGMTTFSTCHAGSYDTQMAVYMVDDCEDFSTFELIGANDDGGNCSVATSFTSIISDLCLEAGVTYYIQVDAYSTFQGADFSISVEFDGGEVADQNVFLPFEQPQTAILNWNYNSTNGGNVDYVLHLTNTVTGVDTMISGNTANLPITLTGLDSETLYEYYVVCADACGTMSTVESFTTSVDGINELGFGTNVNVYPNPVSDKLTVEINATVNEGSVISIISMQGQVIYSEVVKENTSDYRTEIDVDNFARGIYLLKLEDENSSIQQRIIVQ
jgi:hypothetical protein